MRGRPRKYESEEERKKAYRQKAIEYRLKKTNGKSAERGIKNRKSKELFFGNEDFRIEHWRKRWGQEGLQATIIDGYENMDENRKSKAIYLNGVLSLYWQVKVEEDEDEKCVRKRIAEIIRKWWYFDKYLAVFTPMKGYEDVMMMEFYFRLDERPSEETILEVYRATRK